MQQVEIFISTSIKKMQTAQTIKTKKSTPTSAYKRRQEDLPFIINQSCFSSRPR